MEHFEYQLRRLGYGLAHPLYLNIRLKPNVPVLIGRDKLKPTDDPLSNVFIKSRHVSRKHCKVTLWLDGRITLVDSSTNGTFVNGTLVKGTEVDLHVNDIIALGKDSTPEEALNSEDVLFKLELAIEMIKTEKNEPDEVSQSIESSVGVKSEPGQLEDNDVGEVDNDRYPTVSSNGEIELTRNLQLNKFPTEAELIDLLQHALMGFVITPESVMSIVRSVNDARYIAVEKGVQTDSIAVEKGVQTDVLDDVNTKINKKSAENRKSYSEVGIGHENNNDIQVNIESKPDPKRKCDLASMDAIKKRRLTVSVEHISIEKVRQLVTDEEESESSDSELPLMFFKNATKSNQRSTSRAQRK